MSLLYYYIISFFFLIIFLEVIFVLLWVFHNNSKTKLFFRVTIYSFFLLYWIYLYTNINSINIIAKLSLFNVLSLFKEDIFFAFYNPIIPILNITLLQVFIIIVFTYTFLVIKDIFFNSLSKKTWILLGSIIIIGLIYRFIIPDNIWDTGYRDINFSDVISDILYVKAINAVDLFNNWDVLYINTSQYWVWFRDFLQFISKFTFSWSLEYTFVVNHFLELLNILLVFVLSRQLWKNDSLSLWNSLLYVTSIPILRFFSWWHLYIFSTSLLLCLLIFLFKFKESNYEEKKYFIISMLASLVLVYTHNIFILLPLLYPLFFIIFFDKKLIKKLFSPYLIVFYVLFIVFIIPTIKIKTIWGFYISTEQSSEIYKNLNILLDNLFSYLYVFIFTPYNPFLNSEINSYFFIFILVLSIVFYWWKKDDYKILIFFILFYLILILPYSLRFLPNFTSLSYPDIKELLTYNNYKNPISFVMLTDVMIKWSVTLFIFIIFSWNILNIGQSYIGKDILKKIYILVVSFIIILVPIYNYKKIVHYFNVQNDYMFLYKNIENVLDKNIHYNIYYDTLWHDKSHSDEFKRELKGLLLSKKLNFSFNFVPELDINSKNDFKENSIYIIWTSCFTRHKKSDFKWQCIINNKLKDILFVPILEKEIKCDTYDRESYCIKDTIKFWIYKIINKNEKNN